jgi:hypothetical protein
VAATIKQKSELLFRLLGLEVFEVVFQRHRQDDVEAGFGVVKDGAGDDAVGAFGQRAENAIRDWGDCGAADLPNDGERLVGE